MKSATWLVGEPRRIDWFLNGIGDADVTVAVGEPRRIDWFLNYGTDYAPVNESENRVESTGS